MSRIYFKPLPDESTPATAERINGLLNGEESIEKVVVGSVEGKNLFDKNSETKNYFLNDNGILQSNSVWNTSDTIYEIQPNTEYTMSWENIDSSLTTQIEIGEYTSSGSFLGTNFTNNIAGVTSKSIISKANTSYIKIAYRNDKMKNIQFEKGPATDYVPYKKYGYNEDTNMGKVIVEKISGKNLFNGVLTLGAINSTGVDFSDNNSIRSVGYTKVKPNTTYTLNSLDNIKNIVYFYDNNKAYISNIGNNESLHTFTTPSNCEYLRFCTYVSEGATNINSKFQLELGSQATSYQDFNTTQMGNVVVDDITSDDLFKYKGTLTDGYLISTGEIRTSTTTSWKTTDYIPIKPNENYTTSGSSTSLGNDPSRCYYDANKTFISGVAHNGQVPFTDISPSNAYYMRESFRNSEVDTIKITSKSFDNSESEVYSTNEIKIGRWINGKTLYRKTINIGALPNASSSQIAHNISNIDTVINVGGRALTSGAYTIPLPNAGTNTTAVLCNADRNAIFIITGNDKSSYTGYVDLEYTKTTD